MADHYELSIEAEILMFPKKEYYPGFFEEFRRAKAHARDAAFFRSLGNKPKSIFNGEAMDIPKERAVDIALKVVLVTVYRRRSVANDNRTAPQN